MYFLYYLTPITVGIKNKSINENRGYEFERKKGYIHILPHICMYVREFGGRKGRKNDVNIVSKRGIIKNKYIRSLSYDIDNIA